MPIEIEHFLILAALVAAIGFVVRVRDLRSGRAEAPERDNSASMPMRDHLADTGFLPSRAWPARMALVPTGRRPRAAARAPAGTGEDETAG